MASRRRYSAKEKAEAVGLSVVAGATAASEATGIPESSIRSWRDRPEFAALRAEKKDEVVADVWAAFQIGVRRVTELIPTTDDLQRVATATGIIYDKYALMSGQATARTESRALTEGLQDHERAALRALIDEALEAAPATAEGDPG